MAPLPQNNTRRLFLDYTSNGIAHTMILRLPPSAGTADTYAAAYAEWMSTYMRDSDSVFAARYSDALSNFSLPLTFTAVEGVLGPETNVWSQDPESAQLSIVGRGVTTGRRQRIEFFNAVAFTPWPSDNRYNPTEQATIEAMLADYIDLAGQSGELPLVSIGNDPLSIYEYVNIRSNAYWQNQQRLS